MIFSRDQALSLLHEYIKNDKMLAHSHTSETLTSICWRGFFGWKNKRKQ